MAEDETQVESTEETKAAPEPEPEVSSEAIPEDTKVPLNVDGQELMVTATELKQLAYHGAKAVMETYANIGEGSETPEPEPTTTETSSVDDDDTGENTGSAVQKQMDDLKSEIQANKEALRQQEVSFQSQKMSSEVESSIKANPILASLSKDELEEHKVHIYNRMSQRNESAEQAVNGHGDFLGGLVDKEKAAYLRSKLADQSEAGEGSGGGVTSPSEPLTGADLKSGNVKRAAFEYLKSSMKSD